MFKLNNFCEKCPQVFEWKLPNYSFLSLETLLKCAKVGETFVISSRTELEKPRAIIALKIVVGMGWKICEFLPLIGNNCLQPVVLKFLVFSNIFHCLKILRWEICVGCRLANFLLILWFFSQYQKSFGLYPAESFWLSHVSLSSFVFRTGHSQVADLRWQEKQPLRFFNLPNLAKTLYFYLF